MATLEVTTTPGGETRLLALRVTPEQEVAIYAFFQINGWTIITEEIPKHCESCQRALNGEEVEIKCQVCQKAINGEQEQTDTTVQQTVQEVNQNNDNSQSLAVFQQGRKIVLVGNTMTMTKSQPNTNNQETIVIEQAPMSPQKAVQPVPPKIYNINNSAENRPYKCDDCGKHFRKKTHVIAHMKYHSGEALPKCDICGKEFLYKHNLISHASIHSGERPFQCNICPKTFRRKDDLQIHMRTHTGERPYKCDICGKCFTTQNQLPKHRRTHTGEKPYQCSICNKCFRTKPHLEKHHRTHSGERPYLCGECGRAFTQNAHLIAHQRIHTGEKPFQCDECDKAFKESKTLKKHKLIHLNGMPYSCHICGKGFLRQQNLEVHMCVHSDDEPKYKRKLRQKRELMERLKAEEEIAQMEDTIIEEEVSGLEQMEMVKDETSSINTDKVNEVNGNVMVETSEDPAANSIASSLLTLVEMITSAEHEAARAGEVQQVSGEISTTAVPTTTGTVISAASIPSNPNTENIIIQPQEVNASQQGGQIQYQQGVNIIQGQIDTENTHGQGDLQQQNIIITQVEGNDEQIIESVTSQFGDGQTYVVEYVEQDS